jgi:drug/metabolite transporter (DMT)-like permease
MQFNDNFKANFALTAICIIWGGSYLAIGIGLDSIPPLLFLGGRQIISGLVVCAFFILKGQFRIEKSELRMILISGGCIVFVSQALVNCALMFVPGGIAALLYTTVPLWVILLNVILKIDKPGKMMVAGISLALIAMVILYYDSAKDLLKKEYLLGIIAILIANIFWALGSVLTRNIVFNTNPILVAGFQLLVFGSLLFGISIGFESWDSVSIDPSAFYSLAYLVVFDQLIAYVCYIYALSKLPAGIVSIFSYVNPIIALFLGWFFRNEKLSTQTIIASLIIFCAVYLITKKDKQIKPEV